MNIFADPVMMPSKDGEGERVRSWRGARLCTLRRFIPEILDEAATEQPGGPPLPPLPQQVEDLGRKHHITVLAAFRLHDADDHLLAVNVSDPQPRHFAGSQPATIGERRRNVAAFLDLVVVGAGVDHGATARSTETWITNFGQAWPLNQRQLPTQLRKN